MVAADLAAIHPDMPTEAMATAMETPAMVVRRFFAASAAVSFALARRARRADSVSLVVAPGAGAAACCLSALARSRSYFFWRRWASA